MCKVLSILFLLLPLQVFAQFAPMAMRRNGGGATNFWTATNSGSAPLARSNHSAVWTGSVMIVWGGLNGVAYYNTGAIYDPGADAWTATSTSGSGFNSPPIGRIDHSAIWTGTRMAIWGGYDGTSASYLNDGAQYDPVGDTWEQISYYPVPESRRFHTAVWTGSKMIIWGGGSGSKNYQTGGIYDPTSDSWTMTSTVSAPSARFGHSAVWTGTEMIIWGGDDGTRTNSGGRYDPLADTWNSTSTGSNVPEARTNHSAVWTGSEMIVWGGQTSGTIFSTGGRYNPSSNVWNTMTASSVPEGRYAHTAVWTGTEMIVWGGNGTSSARLNTGGRYNPSLNSWTATSTGPNVPTVRSSHTAVVSNTGKMIVWGGVDGFNFYNTGGIYDPSTDTWAATSTGAGVPQGRNGHTAVWTSDNRMIVWGGGLSGSVNTNDGGIYNPIADTWSVVSTGVGVPSIRQLHTAVWSGSKMIVWGGVATSTLNDGGQYDPSTDSWSPVSNGAANVPLGRRKHSTVLTNDGKIIVWGGMTGPSSYTNTGGIYDPVLDSWQPTSIGANVPSVRYLHTAVWADDKMIVWGGYNGTTMLNTGGVFDPIADTWTVTSTGTYVPGARYYHSAVWSGTSMIIWGGYNGSYLNDGGRYDPGTSSWLPTSTTSVPPVRGSHSAYWANGRMIIWGGSDTLGKLNTGGRYDPVADSWVATSTTAVPTARVWHSSVWTGSKLIIWGGDTGSVTNTGGIYTP